MPKLLIISACLINLGTDDGGIDHAEGEFADVPKDTARFLAENGRALYCDKKDDHTKEARFSASDKQLKAAEALGKARAAAAAAAEKA